MVRYVTQSIVIHVRWTDDHILVNLTSAIYGRIHATAIVDKLSVVKAGNVFGSIKKGDTVDVKVKNNKFSFFAQV